ncbi:tegument protein UL51 [Equid alphaherpesvirus 4]|uniref:Tegument protein UL51 homolog n=3 Tax=Equid alphaherpesvirus 4 TaxID=10331 RepID=TEG7_EHV4|nr:tegument protein UL51 [Equid alphaherpesvirus 4]Q00038.1 RecName: Full=Tegument protein UL51 homolog [Equine herpesvirus type 4 (strain 1942)]AAC59597.1 8 [Equid alphaherpesvirus 4] [Equid alphaherpesvirus 4]AMB15896.1 tegument protein UL51 [Equid alphaherpesvirus 4]AMB15975.1 tegument protein UL51 [Equid alphaherpesvirus 4]AMB16054.1 tegument protein UL51 [Equid alphaherpesvirus 4]AMB16133.1 tegument protein UL51 [Equid alphaherpesvirus 4]
MFKWLMSSLCGTKNPASLEEVYEPIMGGKNPATMLRLQSALAAVNALLPATLTIEDVISSADNTRRLVKAQTLARTYQACQHNIECLSRHRASSDNPNLNAVVATHMANAKRLSDTCLAALMHLYLSVGAVDATTDTMVDHAIRMTAENSVVMADVAVLEKTLGLEPQPSVMAHDLLALESSVYNSGNSVPVNDYPAEDVESTQSVHSPLLSKRPSNTEVVCSSIPVKSNLKSKPRRKPSLVAA